MTNHTLLTFALLGVAAAGCSSSKSSDANDRVLSIGECADQFGECIESGVPPHECDQYLDGCEDQAVDECTAALDQCLQAEVPPEECVLPEACQGMDGGDPCQAERDICEQVGLSQEECDDIVASCENQDFPNAECDLALGDCLADADLDEEAAVQCHTDYDSCMGWDDIEPVDPCEAERALCEDLGLSDEECDEFAAPACEPIDTHCEDEFAECLANSDPADGAAACHEAYGACLNG